MSFQPGLINIDPATETEHLVSMLRQNVHQVMRKSGGVVGISGGIDSSTVLALSVHAFGTDNVVAVMMPDKDSDPETVPLACMVAAHFGIEPVLEDITLALTGFRCYERRDEAIRRVFPEYDPAAGYKAKIVLPQNLLEEDTLNVFSVTMITPEGEEKSHRLPLKEFLQIVAASNLKQRTRMSTLYYHAEMRNYGVIGTANKNEYEQGFFVKYGDGGVDIQPIAHLFKTQVYQLAKYLGVPEEIQKRPPTTDTYSASCTQQEFFFRLPFETMDLLWYAQEHNLAIAEVAQGMELTEVQIQRAYNDFSRKQRSTQYLRMPPVCSS